MLGHQTGAALRAETPRPARPQAERREPHRRYTGMADQIGPAPVAALQRAGEPATPRNPLVFILGGPFPKPKQTGQQGEPKEQRKGRPADGQAAR